jgi:hypothetical protein
VKGRFAASLQTDREGLYHGIPVNKQTIIIISKRINTPKSSFKNLKEFAL